MKIDELENGQIVECRMGRAGRSSVEWSPWSNQKLYVQKYKGKLSLITIQDGNWAEAGRSDFCRPQDNDEGGTFVVEDYYLQIKGLEQ